MKLSIIIPVYNEVDNLVLLHQKIGQALNPLPDTVWEAIYVDDGSSDASLSVLSQLANDDPQHVSVIALRRNFGQTTAIAAGIDHSDGEIIVMLDADLQNDPADIPAMVQKIQEGYDLVSGWRVDRQDPFITRVLPSRVANWIISTVTGAHLHDYGCTLKAYRREILTGFKLYGEMHRFIPAYAHSIGARMVELPIAHHPRRFGKTKYNLYRIFKVILDLFTVKFFLNFGQKPIYLFGGTGIFLLALSFITVFVIGLRRILYDEHLIRSPLLLMGTMLFILGFQSILMGLLAELVMRTYHESQHKPTYNVKQVIRDGKVIAG